MREPRPTLIEGGGIRLEPLSEEHHAGLAAAVADGRLWEIWYTAVPSPDDVRGYIADALQGQRDGKMLPWAVRAVQTGEIIGSTRYHDIAPALERVEIGYTFYAASRQRTFVNTTCKLLLLRHAFETLQCQVVGLRTDGFNVRSQRAIEGLGARKDGVIRRFGVRRDGSVRDTVMYSILATEWPDVSRYLQLRLDRHVQSSSCETSSMPASEAEPHGRSEAEPR